MATSLVLVVFNQLELTRACLESLRATTAQFDLCVVDNGSGAPTRGYFENFPHSFRLTYHRNDENIGLIRALNQGAGLARAEFVCFLHNDTEMSDPAWLDRLENAVRSTSRIGLAGLYGARKVRTDGRYVGRTIVHCLKDRGRLGSELVEVAAVDGVCLFLRRSLLESIGGFDEGYGFFHGYDRDLSFSVREAGWRCAVVNAPFVHRGGGTRTGEGAPRRAQDDLEERRRAVARFAAKWQRRLPSDVRGMRERVTDWLVPHRAAL